MINRFLYCLFALLFIVFQSNGQTDILVSPSDSAVINSSSVNFIWDKSDQPVSYYELNVASDLNFSLNNSSYHVYTNSDTLISGFTTLKTYYWKVRSFDGTSYSSWSGTRKFTSLNMYSISSLLFWVKADSGVTADGAMNISSWKNYSDGSNDVIQPVAANQPLLAMNAFNGKPVVRMDGVDDFMYFNVLTNIRDCFFLIKHNTGTQAYAHVLGMAPSSTTPDFHGGAPGTPDGDGMFSTTWANLSITNGKIRKNGTNATFALKRPTEFSIISLFPIGAVSASSITNQRNFPTRFWNGDYAEILLFNQPLPDSVRTIMEKYLRYKYAPPVDLGKNIYTNLCGTVNLDAGSYFVNYLWSTGETTSSITTPGIGKYWVRATDVFGFVSSDTVEVKKQITFNQAPAIVSLCPGNSYLWDTGYPTAGFSFLWQDGSTTTNKFTITQAGKHYVRIKDVNNCFFYSDTIDVVLDNFKTIATIGVDTTLCAGNFIYLQKGASQAASYLWSNGSTNDSLQIFTGGEYRLTAFNTFGCIKKDTIQITIANVAPVANFSLTTTCFDPLLPAATQFTDLSTSSSGSITARKWYFGDLASSTSPNPSHTYADTGSYTAKLAITASPSGCKAEMSKTFIVYPYPQGSFTVTNTTLCERDSVLFNASASTFGYPITQWNWNFGEASSGTKNFSSAQNPKHAYSNTATYTPGLSIQNAGGCVTTITNTLAINPAPTVDFTYSLLCEKQSIDFTDMTTVSTLTIQSSSWDFGDSFGPNPIVSLNPTHTYTGAGTYTVTHVINASNGCSNTNVKVLTINPKPTALYSTSNPCASKTTIFSDTSIISGGTIASTLWKYSNGDTSSLKNETHIFPLPTNTPIKLLVTSDKGCVDSISKAIAVHPTPVASYTYTPTNGGAPLLVNFTNTGSGALTYFWDFKDSNTDTLANTAHTFTTLGTYNVSLITSNNFACSDTALNTVDVVVPHMDVAVRNVVSSLQSSFLTVSAQIVNKGSMDVTTMELIVNLDDGSMIKENWKGLLQRGGVIGDTISTSIYMKDSKHFVCVEAAHPNGLQDEFPSDNKSCVGTNKSAFEVLTPFPIPAGGSITLPILIPVTKNIEVSMYNARGQNVLQVYSGTIQEGIQLMAVDLTGIAKGFYTFKVVYEGEIVVKKFIVD